jgi:transcription elongation factor GreA
MSNRRQKVQNTTIDLAEIRTQVGDVLNRLAANPATDEIKARIALLGQIAAGLAIVDPECLPPDGAGFGSKVTVRNVQTGLTDEYTLMVGSLVDINANQVSLASPIGQALLGKNADEEITIATPTRPVTLRVIAVQTLMDQLEANEASTFA